jgi:hypothetical protein
MPEAAALIVGLAILSLVAWDVLATTLSLQRFVTHTGWRWDDVHGPAGTRDRSETSEPGRQ